MNCVENSNKSPGRENFNVLLHEEADVWVREFRDKFFELQSLSIYLREDDAPKFEVVLAHGFRSIDGLLEEENIPFLSKDQAIHLLEIYVAVTLEYDKFRKLPFKAIQTENLAVTTIHSFSNSVPHALDRFYFLTVGAFATKASVIASVGIFTAQAIGGLYLVNTGQITCRQFGRAIGAKGIAAIGVNVGFGIGVVLGTPLGPVGAVLGGFLGGFIGGVACDIFGRLFMRRMVKDGPEEHFLASQMAYKESLKFFGFDLEGRESPLLYKEIVKRYHSRLKEVHPDKGGTKKQFQDTQEAFSIVKYYWETLKEDFKVLAVDESVDKDEFEDLIKLKKITVRTKEEDARIKRVRQHFKGFKSASWLRSFYVS